MHICEFCGTPFSPRPQINNDYDCQYKTYDPELKRIVAETGDVYLAIKQGVPRTTANYWIT